MRCTNVMGAEDTAAVTRVSLFIKSRCNQLDLLSLLLTSTDIYIYGAMDVWAIDVAKCKFAIMLVIYFV